MRAAAVLALALAAVPGCGLTAALTYPSADDDAVENVVAAGALAYAAASERGLVVIDLATGAALTTIAPPAGSDSVDDVALADGLVFTLDAAEGRLAVWSLAEPARPRLVSGPIEVPVGPFAGVSAGGGRVVVSGGTSALTVWGYDAGGRLGARPGELEVARGQPDVLVAPDGSVAYVSTHFESTVFGLTVVALETPPAAPRVIGRLVLDGAGFSDGGTKPASFPLVAALSGERVYLAYGRGLAAIDVSDPSSPRLVGVTPLGLQAVHVAIAGPHAAVVGASREVALLDLSQRDTPRVIARLPLPSGATGVALSDHHIAVAAAARVIVLPR